MTVDRPRHGEPSDGEIDAAEFSTRLRRGGASMLARQAVVAASSVATAIVLARTFTPQEFGFYAVVLTVVSLSRLLVESGYPAALVQRSETPDRAELGALLGVQLGAAAVLAAALVGGSRAVADVYTDVDGAVGALLLCAVGVLLAPLTGNAMVRLERSLRLAELGLLLAVQPVTFSVLALALALGGTGVVGLGLAFVGSGILTAVLGAWIAGVPPRPRMSSSFLRSNGRFAAHHLGASVISVVKDSVNPSFIAWSAGAVAAGYVNWAQQTAVMATLLVVASGKLFFPAFARLRHDPVRLGVVASRAAQWLAWVTAPIACGMAFTAHDLTSAVYGDQWQPAVPLLVALCAANILAPPAIVATSLLLAVGRSGPVLVASVLYMVLTWTCVIALTPSIDYWSYAVGVLASQAPCIWLLREATQVSSLHFVRVSAFVWLAAAASAAVARTIAGQAFSSPAATVMVAAVLTIVLYLVTTLGWTRGELRALYAPRAQSVHRDGERPDLDGIPGEER